MNAEKARYKKFQLESATEVPRQNLTGQQVEKQNMTIQKKEQSVQAAVSKLDHKKQKKDGEQQSSV